MPMCDASRVPRLAGTAAPATLARRTNVSITSASPAPIGSPMAAKIAQTSNAFSP